MAEKQRILIIDDDTINRDILKKIVEKEYDTIECANGREGIDYISEHYKELSAVLLDLRMGVMDGFEFLGVINSNFSWKNIPIIVITALTDNESEKKALELGAWDFIRKPFEIDIIRTRIKNAIYRSQLAAFVKLKEIAEFDSLTGLYNKDKFYTTTNAMLINNKNRRFVFLRFDIEKFNMVNAFFGMSGGDRLLVYVSDELRKRYENMKNCTFGRIKSDIFGVCHEYDESSILQEISDIRGFLSRFNPEYDIVPNIGLYVIEDNNLPVATIHNRAELAAEQSKDNYIKFYTFYNEKMGSAFIKEQEIVNEMQNAIETNQFDVYFQPKYSLRTNKPYGAEALVRWFHPKKGMIMPGEFIPIFEKDGFISKLDFYVWEKTCQYLSQWIKSGREPYPVSVNVSRVNMYNPKIVEMIKGITDKYNIPPRLLNLELTESAYTDDPVVIKEVISKFQAHGFIIMMDDFGSGYSSLNILKDIMVDVLKVDMRFLSNTDIPGRGENILASVIRMAKWLKLPVIVEGVETASQTRFLKSIGCDYVQGFFFATPMPANEYVKLVDENKAVEHVEVILDDDFDTNSLFVKNPQMEMLFGNNIQPIVIFEFCDDRIEIMRVNEAYYNMLGDNERVLTNDAPLLNVDERYRENVLKAFKNAVDNMQVSEVEYLRNTRNGIGIWIKLRLQFIQKIGPRQILIGTLNDITVQKEIDNVLNVFKTVEPLHHKNTDTMLIVDDHKLDRTILREMFRDKFNVIEAEDGNEALRLLRTNKQIDIIVLDLIMPYMDGRAMLEVMKNDRILKDLPVVVVTSDSTIKSQMEMLQLGVDDYIIKPYVKEIVIKRVENVLVSHNNKDLIQKSSVIADKFSEILK